MDIVRLTAYYRTLLEFVDLQVDQAYFYQSLSLCVIDAVNSIGVRYSSTEATVQGDFPSPPALPLNGQSILRLACFQGEGVERCDFYLLVPMTT